MNLQSRWLSSLGAIAVLGAAAWIGRAPMRISLVNTTVRIDDPWTRAAALGLAALGVIALAAALPARKGMQRLLAGCGIVTLMMAAVSAATWVEARPGVLTARRWFVRTTIPWNEVTRVDTWRDAMVVWSGSGARIVIDAGRLDAHQRAVLERTIARHVREGF